MNKKPFIFIATTMAAVALFCIISFISSKSDHTGEEDPGMVFIALQPVEGLEIKGENPISLRVGEDITFTASTDEDHYIAASDRYTYENGVLHFGPASTSCTLYVNILQYYKVSLSTEGAGQVAADSLSLLKSGDSVTCILTPDEGQRIKSVKVNGIYQLFTEGEPFVFTVSGDTELSVAFEEIPAPPRTEFSVIIMNDGEPTTLPQHENLAPGTVVTLPIADAATLQQGDYNLIGYNTAPDFSGTYYALGSMVTVGSEDMVLYPQWIKYTDASEFTGKVINSRYLITKYTGTPVDGTVCIPPFIDGIPVTDILYNAFDGIPGLTTVIFPVGMCKLENNTIINCPDFTTLVLPETMETFSSLAVSNCPNFKHFRVIGTYEHVFTNAFDAALSDKFMRLQNTEGKRIIVVAGSSTSFGLSSQMLKDAFPEYEIINFGNSYLAGIHPSLQLLSHFIHEGDIIILAPEYYNSTYGVLDPVKTSIWNSVESNLNMLEYFDMSTYSAIMDSFTSTMNMVRSSIASGKPPYNLSPFMLKENFNEYGDLASVRPEENKTVFNAFPEGLVTERGMQLYNSYADEFAKKGAICLFSFPPTYVKKTSAALTSWAERLMKDLSAGLGSNCPIISDPMDYMFTENIFFDNYYHPTLEGATRRTELLIRDLNAYLQR